MTNATKDVIYLVSCVVNNTIPEKKRVNEMDIESVYAFSARHMISALAATGLKSAGISDAQIDAIIASSIRRAAYFEMEWQTIREKLEDAHIWYMPLKGAVLKDIYPAYGMREMSDYDILIESARAEDIKIIMESLGFTVKSFGRSSHDVYHKPPVANFEMHSSLFGPSHDKKLYSYYTDVKNHLVKDYDNKYGWHFTNEDMYIYMTAHEYKHFTGGGTGLRSFLDIYVFMKKYSDTLDMTYIEKEMLKLGIAEFEKQSRELAFQLFGNHSTEDVESDMMDYVLRSGVYGTTAHRVYNKVKQFGGGTNGKMKYFFTRLFIPVENIKMAYPFIYKHRIFLPFFYIYRIIKSIILRRAAIRKELKVLFGLSTKQTRK